MATEENKENESEIHAPGCGSVKKGVMPSMEQLIENTFAKRLYLSLLPVDNLMRDLQAEIDDNERASDDEFYMRVWNLRVDMINLFQMAIRSDESETCQ